MRSFRRDPPDPQTARATAREMFRADVAHGSRPKSFDFIDFGRRNQDVPTLAVFLGRRSPSRELFVIASYSNLVARQRGGSPR